MSYCFVIAEALTAPFDVVAHRVDARKSDGVQPNARRNAAVK
jgi:hypothetical protein